MVRKIIITFITLATLMFASVVESSASNESYDLGKVEDEEIQGFFCYMGNVYVILKDIEASKEPAVKVIWENPRKNFKVEHLDCLDYAEYIKINFKEDK